MVPIHGSRERSGVDLTKPFVEAPERLTHMVKMDRRVVVVRGDGCDLPDGRQESPSHSM
jgi:hypothetical protein